jgi:hypothetical protein
MRARLAGWWAPLLLVLLPAAFLWRGVLGQLLLVEADGLAIFLPMRRLFAAQVAAGTPPLWNPNVFGGAPFFGAMQTGMLFPFTWLFLLLPPLAAMNGAILALHVCAALATYGYARAIGCARPAAAFAGAAFGTGGYLLAHGTNVAYAQGIASLPLLLIALERMRWRRRARDIAVGVAAVALGIFAGHPQAPAYTLMVGALYAAYFGLVHAPAVGRLRYLGAAALVLGGGVALTAVQLLPGAEMAALSARPRMAYSDFVSFSLPAPQLPMLLFPFLFGGVGAPYWGDGIFLEEMAYPGVIVVMLAAAAVGRARCEPLVRFWTLIAGLTLALAVGDSLPPLARLMYHVPFYNLFRAPARTLVIFGLAVALLAALTLSEAPSAARRRRLLTGAAVTVAVMLAIAALAAAAPEWWAGFAARGSGVAPDGWQASLALTNASVWLPLLLAAAAAAAVGALARWPSRLPLVVVCAAYAVDIGSFWSLLPINFCPPALATAVDPAARYLLDLPEEQRGRTAVVLVHDAELNLGSAAAGLALVNGYDSMPMARYAALAGGMQYWGAISIDALLGPARFLDLLNARHLWLETPAAAPLRHHVAGARFAAAPLGVLLRPGDAVEWSLPAPRRVDAVAAVSGLGESVAMAQDTPVARITVIAADGRRASATWRAGVETAEWAWARPDVQPLMAHRQATIAEPLGADGRAYVGTAPLPESVEAVRVRVEYIAPHGALELLRLTLRDRELGRDYPVSALFRLLDEGPRWQRRYGDENGVVLENHDALPPAWLVPRTRQLAPSEILTAAHDGVLPDGTPFDPRAEALVEDQPGRDFGVADPLAEVRVESRTPLALALRTRAAAPAFLVLSEVDYPGWEARVDGEPVALVRTNYVLRGLPLPAGEHRVDLRYAPRPVWNGGLLSLAAALVVAIAAWRWRHA